ncbi:MAG: hypothetical protein K2X66_04405 [Cyanobacteria bacterium]|nr:hypothetical protein [Cyanobacteriota bacterium]
MQAISYPILPRRKNDTTQAPGPLRDSFSPLLFFGEGFDVLEKRKLSEDGPILDTTLGSWFKDKRKEFFEALGRYQYQCAPMDEKQVLTKLDCVLKTLQGIEQAEGQVAGQEIETRRLLNKLDSLIQVACATHTSPLNLVPEFSVWEPPHKVTRFDLHVNKSQQSSRVFVLEYESPHSSQTVNRIQIPFHWINQKMVFPSEDCTQKGSHHLRFLPPKSNKNATALIEIQRVPAKPNTEKTELGLEDGDEGRQMTITNIGLDKPLECLEDAVQLLKEFHSFLKDFAIQPIHPALVYF